MIIHCDRRGYCLVKLPDGRYKAGCRGPWTRDQALAHWGGANYPDPDRGAQFVQSIEADVEITVLPDGLEWLSLDGGTLPAGVALPATARLNAELTGPRVGHRSNE